MGWFDAIPHHWQTTLFPICFRYRIIVGKILAYKQYFYSYNYNIFTNNVRYRTLRNYFPFVIAALFGSAYGEYKQQVLKVNLFDEYCWLRSQELVKQNEYLFQHEGTLYFLFQTSKNSSGGKKIWEILSRKSTDKPTITTPVTSRTQNLSFKTSSIDTLTPAQNHQWKSTPSTLSFDRWLFRKYIHSILFIQYHIYFFLINFFVFIVLERLIFLKMIKAEEIFLTK